MTSPTVGASSVRTPSATSRCLDAVSATLCSLFDVLDDWRDRVIEVEHATGSPSRDDIDALIERLVVEPLSAADATIIGAGFVARPGFVADDYWHLSWWLGEGNTLMVAPGEPRRATRRLDAETDPTSESFRDYTALEWWRVPERTGRRHITGPYVDYLCTDDYTLTLTTPVIADDALLGVVGVDIYVKRIETILMPHLVGIGSPATIVNASGRVVASTDPHRAAGSILRIGGLGEHLHARSRASADLATTAPAALDSGGTVHDCAGTTLALVVGQ